MLPTARYRMEDVVRGHQKKASGVQQPQPQSPVQQQQMQRLARLAADAAHPAMAAQAFEIPSEGRPQGAHGIPLATPFHGQIDC